MFRFAVAVLIAMFSCKPQVCLLRSYFSQWANLRSPFNPHHYSRILFRIFVRRSSAPVDKKEKLGLYKLIFHLSSEFLSEDDGHGSLPDDAQVYGEGTCAEIVEVVVETAEHFLQCVGVAVVEGGVREESRTYFVEVDVGRVYCHNLVNEILAFGTRTYETHVAAQHVDELGELVEVVGTDESAYAGKARLLACGEFGADNVARTGFCHGAELVDGEGAAVAADALLAEEDGALRFFELDAQCNDEAHG